MVVADNSPGPLRPVPRALRPATIGAGRIGSNHAEIVARHIPGVTPAAVGDPGPFTADPARIPQWTIFLETLVHDFDTLCWLNPGAEPLSVHATADALVRPDAWDRGHLDTAVVTVRFDNGAIATAEASFSALYGYDVRAEVFGSEGMVTAGDARTTDMTFYGARGIHVDTARRDTDLLRAAYVGELTAFADSVRHKNPAAVTGHDARRALSVALAAIRSVETDRPVTIAEVTA
ncbi:Gfo/Idh/MocA family oxidoreductase [Streptomyces sp. NPDC094038]|uniref:Gfo/Idh/MocA family protein n=1 Tax=Streptomyces sp. NPDC094038 TaxID=3366055 RepID=UPI0037FF9414